MQERQRRTVELMEDWAFQMPGDEKVRLNLPHTWNAVDGQDGGNDYKRLSCAYEKSFPMPSFDQEKDCVYLEFEGVNASCTVRLNDVELGKHDGGYSTFRFDITKHLRDVNKLSLTVDNSVNDRVYPQKADFTFYGGIYRPVRLCIVAKEHFILDYHGGNGLKITAKPVNHYQDGEVFVESFLSLGEKNGEVEFIIFDKEDVEISRERVAVSHAKAEKKLFIPAVHLWNGVKDPYCYRLVARLYIDGELRDEIREHFGVRDYVVTKNKGFYLNGRPYPLHGVSRHQDRKALGNAITETEHIEDMALIKELGANTIRLAHYQHSQTFYDLCDQEGMVVWAEIPYISEHLPNARENSISQMKELIVQNYNHPSICFWGISNEITISTKDHKDMMENHKILNDLCHEMDSTRLTTLACYAACLPWDTVVHQVSDLVGYNYYLGWYTPFPWLNDVIMGLFHLVYPKRRMCYSEYGAEAMPNLHARNPKRGDHTEEYQLVYLEYMLKFFDRNPWMWGNYLWNMFDFAADARDQGGEPGMNHKGLVTFDRKTKKDSFFLYKAWWSESPVLHITGKRREDREEETTEIKVYSNLRKVALYVNGTLQEEKTGDKIFTFQVPMEGEIEVEARAGELKDSATFKKVSKANPSYTLKENKSKSANWT